MVEIDTFECDSCDEAYPHPLLLDKHKFDEHPAWRERLDRFISGDLPQIGG